MERQYAALIAAGGGDEGALSISADFEALHLSFYLLVFRHA